MDTDKEKWLSNLVAIMSNDIPIDKKPDFPYVDVRLLELLHYVLPIPSETVPQISILREFIGGSYFEK